MARNSPEQRLRVYQSFPSISSTQQTSTGLRHGQKLGRGMANFAGLKIPSPVSS
tara:strand:- start:446 stop:607 length:162 start_codon:yes stop_codon:yes gene_type:complete